MEGIAYSADGMDRSRHWIVLLLECTTCARLRKCTSARRQPLYRQGPIPNTRKRTPYCAWMMTAGPIPPLYFLARSTDVRSPPRCRFSSTPKMGFLHCTFIEVLRK